MQYKNKKNLYKIVFITILLGFIISLVGCNWLSLGLLNIFDPEAQIRVKEITYEENTNESVINLKVFTLNNVEFIGSGFEFEYYRGNNKLTDLSGIAGGYYYIAAESSLENTTEITGLCLYTSAVLDYVKTYSAFNEVTCNLYIIGTDGAGHDLKVKVASGLPALGVDNTPPTANIVVTPASGDCPLTVFFDGSGSTDGDGIGIAKYEWYLPQVSSSIMSTDISFSKELACSLITTDSDEVITVNLTVTDYHGNQGSAAESVKITKPESTGGCTL
ncbi:MAG: hypothetical protein U9O91_05960 [Candidatus Caldatribacteriota bacterium]|nr:hypothetical protein [Candidatus Caldatribacteriota bacterium]